MQLTNKISTPITILYDRALVWTFIALIVIGIVMITSASMPLSDSSPYQYAQKQITQLGLAFVIFIICLYIPISFWDIHSAKILAFGIMLLIAVLLIGTTVNGSKRWISLVYFNFQPSEFIKLALFIYLANYLTRKQNVLATHFKDSYLKPFIVIVTVGFFLLLQPDLGTVIVLFSVSLCIVFIGGANLFQFLLISISGIVLALGLIVLESYRFKRLMIFMNPWQDAQDSGYQLINSLMAIGNGGLFGSGLNNSFLKYKYLPEAHTDFIFSILSEELGYVGVSLIIFILFFIVIRALKIGKRGIDQYKMSNNKNRLALFSGYLACEIGIWFGLQTFVNIGVTSSLVPTKGLTLPFVSYGGSSLVMTSIAAAILLRIDFEYRSNRTQARII